MPNKLFIYNTEFWDMFRQLHRFDPMTDTDVTFLPATDRRAVHRGLDNFLAKRMVFDRVLFQTHGDSGLIWFGDDPLYTSSWASYEGKGYERLFPTYARIYFDGCNVGDGEEGVKFLRAAGRVFLKGMGGEVTAWSSFGLGLPAFVPFIGGHTIHPCGHIVKVKFAPGDTVGTLESPEEAPVEEATYYPGGA